MRKRKVLFLMVAVALAVGLLLPMAAPVLAYSLLTQKTELIDPGDPLHPVGVYLVGMTVHYDLYVENTHSTDDATMDIYDIEPSGSPTVQLADDLTLEPGNTWSTTYDYVVEAGDVEPHAVLPINVVINTLYVEGIQGIEVFEAEGTQTVQVVEPSVDVSKEADTELSKPTDTINYTITVTNDGDWPIVPQSVVDTLLDDKSADFTLTLLPGESESHSYDYVVPDPAPADPLVNEVTATYVAQDFDATIEGATVSDTDTAEVDLVTPCIDVEKTADPTTSKVGDEVVYTIEVCNCGDIDLENVTVVDDLLGDLSGSYADTLAVGACESHDFTRTVLDTDPDPLENCVDVNSDPVGPMTNPTPDRDCAEVDLVTPCIDVEKTADPTTSKVGDEVTYTIEVCNCGDIDLENVTVVDDLLGDLSGDYADVLPVGECESHDFTRTVLDTDPDPLVNCVEVHANPVGLPNDVPDTDCAEVDLVRPCIEVEKTVSPEVSKEGDEVVYTICVNNCGDVELDIEVVDSLLGPLAFPPVIGPGDTICLDFPYVIQPGDPDPLENCVEVTASPPELPNIYVEGDCAEVDLVEPCIDVEKTADPTTAAVGETITYTIEVCNCGDIGLENVTVVDDLLGDLSGDYADTLAVGECESHDFTRVILDTDPDPLVNCVEVNSDPVGPMTNPISDRDCAEVDIEVGQGLTPGFWKNHPACWECFSPDDQVGLVFLVPPELADLRDDTLMDALRYHGGRGIHGAARNLLRQATAALLNACHSNVNYPMSVAEVIAATDAALATLDRGLMLRLKDVFDMNNNLGGGIDAHCRPIDD